MLFLFFLFLFSFSRGCQCFLCVFLLHSYYRPFSPVGALCHLSPDGKAPAVPQSIVGFYFVHSLDVFPECKIKVCHYNVPVFPCFEFPSPVQAPDRYAVLFGMQNYFFKGFVKVFRQDSYFRIEWNFCFLFKNNRNVSSHPVAFSLYSAERYVNRQVSVKVSSCNSYNESFFIFHAKTVLNFFLFQEFNYFAFVRAFCYFYFFLCGKQMP